MSNPIDSRKKKLETLVNSIIENGWIAGHFTDKEQNISPNDVILIQDYCINLGFKAAYKPITLKDGTLQGNLDLSPYKKPPDPEEGINITISDYNFLKFCRNNSICKFLYKFSGKN